MSHNRGMNAGRESDGRVVPAKCPNKGGSFSPAEGMEGRRPTKDTLGVSGRTMLGAIVNGEQDSQRLAEMSRGLLRNKIPQLQQALEGRVTEHHRFLQRELLAASDPPSQPAEPEYVGAFRASRGAVAPQTQDSSSISHGAL